MMSLLNLTDIYIWGKVTSKIFSKIKGIGKKFSKIKEKETSKTFRKLKVKATSKIKGKAISKKIATTMCPNTEKQTTDSW